MAFFGIQTLPNWISAPGPAGGAYDAPQTQ